MTSEEPRFAEAEVHRQCEAILRAWGLPEAAARTTAGVMAYTDLSGVDSHGISMFPNYEKLLHSGELDVGAEPVVVRENSCTALVDGRAGFGHPVAVTGMNMAIDKAAAFGVGVVSVCNSHHFGAAGYYSAMAAEREHIGIAMTSARTPAVVPTGGAQPRLPTNPLSFAAPAGRNEPFVLDMSTSTVAINKLKVHDLRGRPLPEGWFTGPDGTPVTDAGAALRAAWGRLGGGLTPLGGSRLSGGHKGYGLSLMVQILSSALPGATLATTREGGPDDIGHFFLVLDPAVFRPGGGFAGDVDEIIDAMHDTEPAQAEHPVLVAGEPESAARAHRRVHGIPLPESLLARLRGVCERTGAPFLLDRV